MHVLLQWRNSRVWRKDAGKQGLDCARTISWSNKYSPVVIAVFFFCAAIQYFFVLAWFSDKTKYFRGTSAEIGRPQVFASPFFPEEYVLNSEVYKYVFQAVTLDEFITISFDDWQLSQYSSILVSLFILIPTSGSLSTHPYSQSLSIVSLSVLSVSVLIHTSESVSTECLNMHPY